MPLGCNFIDNTHRWLIGSFSRGKLTSYVLFFSKACISSSLALFHWGWDEAWDTLHKNKELCHTWIAMGCWVQEWIPFLIVIGRWESSWGVGGAIPEDVEIGWKNTWGLKAMTILVFLHINTSIKSFTLDLFCVVVIESFFLLGFYWCFLPLTTFVYRLATTITIKGI